MKQILLIIATCCYAFASIAQEVFFKSTQSYTGKELGTFYASITLQHNLLLFNAPDYHLYAYDVNNATEKWNYYLNRKSDIPPFFSANTILANNDEQVIQLDTASGALLKSIPVTRLETAPITKNGILYGTGIYDGGSLFAYHLEKDTLLWKIFLAHGVSEKPYYLPDKIIANAEGNNWLEVAYTGSLTDTTCKPLKDEFPSELPCVKKFLALTHDGKEIRGKMAEKMGEPERSNIWYTAKNTILVNHEQLFILGNNLTLKLAQPLSYFTDNMEVSGGPAKILHVDEATLWMLYNDRLIEYNFRKKTLTKTTDLSSWSPHQAILKNNRLWLISRKDGLLYGININ